MRIKKNDTVIVIAGKDKGKTGKVLQTLPKKNRVVVEGVNIITKHQKPQGPGQEGGRLTYEAPIDISNVMYYDGEKRTRIGYRFEDGKKVRYQKSNGKTID